MQEMELTYVGTCSCCNHVMHKWVLSMTIYQLYLTAALHGLLLVEGVVDLGAANLTNIKG